MPDENKLETLLAAIAELKKAVEEKKPEKVEKVKEEVEKAKEEAVEEIAKKKEETEGRKTAHAVDVEIAKGNLTKLHKSRSTDPAVVEFQKKADDVFIVSKLLGIPATETSLYKELIDPMSELTKALTIAGGAGKGTDWVPTLFSGDLIRQVELQLRVAALHNRVNMPSDPFKFPAKLGNLEAKLGVEATAPTAGDPAAYTGNITLTSVELVSYVPFSYTLEEDSIIAVLPVVREDIVASLARGQETAVVNGDTTATHMDSDTTDAEDARKAWKGYRKLAVSAAKTDAGNVVATVAMFRAMRKSMGRYGVDPANLAYVVPISVYIQMLEFPELLTLDKYGANATIMQGELGRFDGSPVIVSEYMRENLNASGVYDGSVVDRTVAHTVYRPAFIFGDRRNVLVEMERQIKTRTTDLVTSQRVAFTTRFAATEKMVATLYNLAK